MRLDDGRSVLIHLGMSGRLNLTRSGPDSSLHEHAVFTTDDGWRVGLVDPRRFGALDLIATDAEDSHRLLATLGPEPLEPDFNATTLAGLCAGKKAPLKAALLDQRLVAGLGNIYVNEALFRAGLSPMRLAGTVATKRGMPRAARLVASIKSTLTEAIAAGGSSLRDYVQPDGELGYFQHAWKVYGKAGKPCPDCPGEPCPGIERLVQSGRSTFLCRRRQV
jgi:formamidopyrimidine-DNA glycosylase